MADILLISGSLRAGSSNSALLRTAATLVPDGFRAVTYEGMADLPHFNPDDDGDPLPAAVVGLRRAIEDAAALLVCTPEYAGALPGSFKNLLDWTVGGVEICDKPTAWINVSASATKAANAHESLRLVGVAREDPGPADDLFADVHYYLLRALPRIGHISIDAPSELSAPPFDARTIPAVPVPARAPSADGAGAPPLVSS